MKTALLTLIVLPAALAAQTEPTEARVPAGGASLYARVVGQGRPTIVLHGGPDFDHGYFLPDLDRLGDAFRLFYYDQRGRGRSAEGVRPEDVTMASDVDDVERVRQHFSLDAPVILGHSWGTTLALEYALKYPSRVSRLILMNPAPNSAADFGILRDAFVANYGPGLAQQGVIQRGAAYKSGIPDTVAARYRLHFRPAFKSGDAYEKLMSVMLGKFREQGSAGILKAWAVEDRLMAETWALPTYDLYPKLRALKIPTLIIWADHDFIPGDIARHLAATMPNATLVTIEDCGHFSFLECPADVRSALDRFFAQP